MTLATLRPLLDDAVSGRYALAGLVVQGWEDALAFTQAAEEAGLPVILQAGPGARRHTPVGVLGKMFRHLAEQARVPVCCHVDHAVTLEECIRGIDAGFTSVMIDGSALPLSDNIALTRRVVAAAAPAGVSVEGEVGVVGYAGGQASATTHPDEAARFAAETGVDALAVSVGNVHLQTEATEGIDLAALEAVTAATHLPLVLHGGSGIAPGMRRRLARRHRIAKFNIGTELRQAFGAALRQELADHPQRFDRIEILSATIPAQRAAALAVIRNLGPG